MSSLPEPRIASWTMQQPLPVTLLHVQVSRNANGTTTLSCSHRFRSKFVTIVIHKPERPSVPEAYQRAMAAQAQQQQAQQQQQQQQQQGLPRFHWGRSS